MLKVQGFNISEIPFKELKLISEIVSFEGLPILVHYQDSKKNDLISYYVDFDQKGTRWLLGKITKKELFDYLIGNKSLKTLLSEISSDYLFLVDRNLDDEISSIQLINSYLIPEKYLPNDESFHLEGLTNFYETFLTEDYYLYRLRENSFIIKVEPTNKKHQNTVGAKEAATVLNYTTSSVEGYIKVKAFNLLKDKFADVSKINRRISKTKNILSPRISEAAFGSFEVWLAIDTLTFHGEDSTDTEIRKNLIEGYKHDVLDVDFTSEEDAKIINEKYTEEERKMIYEPILRLLENDDLIISISDHNKTIKRNQNKVKSSPIFKNTILPPPTIEEIQKEFDRKNKIISLVINLKEGADVTKVGKKELMENLLFSQEIAETPYDIESPIEINGQKISLKKSLRCILSIAENGHLQLYNSALEIFTEGEDIHSLVNSIKTLFFELVVNLEELKKINYPRAMEVQDYLI